MVPHRLPADGAEARGAGLKALERGPRTAPRAVGDPRTCSPSSPGLFASCPAPFVASSPGRQRRWKGL